MLQGTGGTVLSVILTAIHRTPRWGAACTQDCDVECGLAATGTKHCTCYDGTYVDLFLSASGGVPGRADGASAARTAMGTPLPSRGNRVQRRVGAMHRALIR